MIQADYDLLEEHLTLLIVKDRQSGAVLAYDCEAKGPGDAWVVKQLVSDLADWGRVDICLMSDGAITALQRAVANARPERQTLLRNSPPYNPQSNGGAEKAAQDVVGIMRRLMLALEARLRQRLDLRLPIVRWLVRHAAFVLTRYQVGHDGLTPWRRLTGRTWNGVVAEFGEQVMGRLALKKPSTDRKVKRGKRKLAERVCQRHLGRNLPPHGRARHRVAERGGDPGQNHPQISSRRSVGPCSSRGSPGSAQETSTIARRL